MINSEQPPTTRTPGNVGPFTAAIGKYLLKNREGLGEINRWRCRRSASLFCWEGERGRESVSEPANTHTMWWSMAVFIHSRHVQWAPFLSSSRNCFPCQSKGVEMEAWYRKACALLCSTCLMNKFSKQPQLEFNSAGCTHWQYIEPLWTRGS